MADEKKPESPGPVVIRKGHVKPPPEGTQIEPPVVETLAPEPGSAPAAAPDSRPLWQRLADEKKGGSPPGSRAPRPERGPGGGRPGGGKGGGRGGPGRRERPPREDRERSAGAPSAPPVPVDLPPMPEVEIPDEGSFADMFASSQAAPAKKRVFKPGEKVAGKIIQIGADVVFLELGSGFADGMIETVELKNEEGNVPFREGDIIDAVVVKGGERGVVVSRGKAQHRDHGREAVIEAARTGLPVEGLVKAVNKGGLEVEVHAVRAFCPMSQIDVRFVGDPATLVGQKLAFRVQKADERDVVLSRRALLEEERAAKAKETRDRLVPGAIFDGAVTSVQDYGAFVDLGGIEGLVHVSELAWDRVSKPQDLLKAGDKVQVQVLRIDQDEKKGERIGLSIRALTPRPEPVASAEPARPVVAPPPPPRVGAVVEVTVDKIEPFGVFVRFAGGRGLVPASETGTPRGSDLRKAFKVGDAFGALIEAIDERGRIRLSRSGAEAAAERAEAREWMQKSAPAKGQGRGGFGTLGDLLKEKLKK
ncbi:MAG TPA: S1 RNA-binding domain-containing protein [Anaeromyxobacteraceae bacterium]|nr:S1 RNA-binding domain-containing protein [Anaeromyxobacteraceae bacterium]